MQFLDNSVLPQSAPHLMLLKYLLVLTFIIFFTYTGILFGSLSLSLFFNKKSVKSGDKLLHNFSKKLIDLITFNKGVAFALGVVPLLSAVFCYAQFLHLTSLDVTGYLLLSLLLFAAGLILTYTYKYTFHLKDIFQFADEKKDSAKTDESLKSEIESYSGKTVNIHSKSGLYGLILLAVAVYLFSGAVQLAGDTSRWQTGNSLTGIIFSFSTLFYFLQFLVLSLALTTSAVLYFFFNSENSSSFDETYRSFVKSFALSRGLVAVILLPLVIALTVVVQPIAALSFGFFEILTVALILLLVLSIMFYIMIKESSIKYRASAIYLLIIVVALLVIKDHFAFDTDTKMHTEVLAAEYVKYEKKTLEEAGLTAAPAINGADIYNGRCIACHAFDHRVVGPPYNSVLPKYEGKKDELVKFIMNPVKKNPDYPSMPNQGLKPNEADAVATWLLQTYKTK